MARNRYPFGSLTLIALAFTCSPTQAQFSDSFDGAGNETYPGVNGFGSFNWVNALNFGFATQQGQSAFLSNYTGLPIAHIGMIKPFTTIMQNTTYRVSFSCSRYSSTSTLGIADYDTLYIGSRHGTMVWDTVPTPVNDYEWVRWSGLYTPAPQDIGQPFSFGFSITLNSGISFALDGPMTITDVATGIAQELIALDELVITPDPGGAGMQVRAERPMADVEVFDARGARVVAAPALSGTSWHFGTAGLPSSLYIVRVRMTDGTLWTGKVMLH
ncbi:MAG: hypothetical protein IPM49_16075 [Flavobacteriales bacterium]|nr:hypothetical protein [Flavobacteriales bacterium]